MYQAWKIYHCLYGISELESNVNCFYLKHKILHIDILYLSSYIEVLHSHSQTQQDCCCHVLVHSKALPANLQHIIWKNFGLDLKPPSNPITWLFQCLIICISMNVFPHMINHFSHIPVQTEEKPPHFFQTRMHSFGQGSFGCVGQSQTKYWTVLSGPSWKLWGIQLRPHHYTPWSREAVDSTCNLC